MTTFDDIALCCEAKEDCLQAISRFCSWLRNIRGMLIHSQNMTSLTLASQLVQDIENSLKFSSKHSFIPKVREQSKRQPEVTVKPNFSTTKNPKGKSVIGESSKQDAKGT